MSWEHSDPQNDASFPSLRIPDHIPIIAMRDHQAMDSAVPFPIHTLLRATYHHDLVKERGHAQIDQPHANITVGEIK
jgi:hypothetical protein